MMAHGLAEGIETLVKLLMVISVQFAGKQGAPVRCPIVSSETIAL
jgi:hypothetical protein